MAARHQNLRPTARLRRRVNRALDGGGIQRDPIAHRAKIQATLKAAPEASCEHCALSQRKQKNHDGCECTKRKPWPCELVKDHGGDAARREYPPIKPRKVMSLRSDGQAET